MTHEERGAYILLLCLQWTQGAVTSCDIERVCGGNATALAARVASKFVTCEDGLLRNARMEDVRQKQDENRENKRKAGKKGAETRWGNATAMRPQCDRNAVAMADPMADPMAKDGSPSPSPIYTHTQEENGKAKPSLETIKLQCAKIGLPTEEAEKFLNYQEARGWTIGKSKIKSWTAALNIWKSNWRPSPQRAATSPTASNGRPKWAVIKDLEAELAELEGRLPCYFDRDADPVGAARIKEIQASLKTLKAERAENE